MQIFVHATLPLLKMTKRILCSPLNLMQLIQYNLACFITSNVLSSQKGTHENCWPVLDLETIL
jgi:hypothetical protein